MLLWLVGLPLIVKGRQGRSLLGMRRCPSPCEALCFGDLFEGHHFWTHFETVQITGLRSHPLDTQRKYVVNNTPSGGPLHSVGRPLHAEVVVLQATVQLIDRSARELEVLILVIQRLPRGRICLAVARSPDTSSCRGLLDALLAEALAPVDVAEMEAAE